MALSVHTRSILTLITHLVNSDHDGETLVDREDVRALATQHDFSPPIRITGEDVAQLRALRARLREALSDESADTAEDFDERETRVAHLTNELFTETRTLPQLRKHDHWDWHLHAVPNESGIAERAAADVAVALADVVIEGETNRFGTCAADDCRALFVDLSRNRSKRFCDRGNCANRTHVAAFRARQTDSADSR
jgi:predicted RNA-binding Zn ribbon-like protein